MTDCKKIAELIFSDVDKSTEYYEELYPARNLPEGARVTRFAPSPTGYLHFGGLYAGFASKLTADTTGGVFMLRIEDTDKKREVEDGVTGIVQGLQAFGVGPDEGVTGFNTEYGDYGPYTQSHRREIYRAFAKKLTEEGKAYPCFCTPEELDEIRAKQENEDIKGYYGSYAKCRDLTDDEIIEKVNNGIPFTVRLRSIGDISRKIKFDDMIKGKIEMSENVNDVVIYEDIVRLFGEKDSRLYFYDSDLDKLRIKLFLENIGYIQEYYEFNELEKEVFPILFRYMNSFWWFHLDEIALIKEDNSKIDKLFDWLEHQMTRDDICLP